MSNSGNSSGDGIQYVLGGMAALIAAWAVSYTVGYAAWVPIFVHPRSPYYFRFIDAGPHHVAIVLGGAGITASALSLIIVLVCRFRFDKWPVSIAAFVAVLGVAVAFVVAPKLDLPARAADVAFMSKVDSLRSATLQLECFTLPEQQGQSNSASNPCGPQHKSRDLLFKVNGVPAGVDFNGMLTGECRVDQYPLGIHVEFYATPTPLAYNDYSITVPPGTCGVSTDDNTVRKVTLMIYASSVKGQILVNSVSSSIDPAWWLGAR